MKDSAAFVRESKEDFVCVNKIGLLPALLTGYLLNRKKGEMHRDAQLCHTIINRYFWDNLFFFATTIVLGAVKPDVFFQNWTTDGQL